MFKTGKVKRNIYSLILSTTLFVGVISFRGIPDFAEFILYAWTCLIAGGLIIMILEHFGSIHKEHDVSEQDSKWSIGFIAYEEGKEHYLARNYEKAIDSFTKAIQNGFDENVYGLRGECYQSCELHDKAIDDFNAAISLQPEDCNLYFMRSNSKNSQGDHDGEINDLQEAVRLSRIDSERNKAYYLSAQEMGWPDGHTSLYQRSLQMTEILK